MKPEQVDVVRRMRSEGAKVAPIARAVSLSRPTVYAILAEPTAAQLHRAVAGT